MLSKEKVLLTGAAGRIGTHLRERLGDRYELSEVAFDISGSA